MNRTFLWERYVSAFAKKMTDSESHREKAGGNKIPSLQ